MIEKLQDRSFPRVIIISVPIWREELVTRETPSWKNHVFWDVSRLDWLIVVNGMQSM